MARILVTGFAGGLAQRVGAKLLDGGHTVVGVDYRPIPKLAGRLASIVTYRANYNKTAIEDVFKRHAFERVLHLGRVGNLKESIGKRFDLNVVGSQKIMNLCVAANVKRLVVLSTFHIYGADARNHIPIGEDEPLRAGTRIPQLADAIQLDSLATGWVYQHPQTSVVVLRPTNVVGPTIHNAMSQFLRLPVVPHLMGFNPMTQFVHEDDMADAIVAASDSTERGVYNVAGPAVVPWRTALELVEAPTFPVPAPLVAVYLRIYPQFPSYLVDFFKYPCVIADGPFRAKFGWTPKTGIRETLWSTVAELRTGESAA